MSDEERLNVLKNLIGEGTPPEEVEDPLKTTLQLLLSPELEETDSLVEAFLLLQRRNDTKN